MPGYRGDITPILPLRRPSMTQNQAHVEKEFAPISGWPVLGLCLLIVATAIALAATTHGVSIGIGAPLLALIAPGFFIVGPNISRVLVLFGTYRGSVRKQGIWY